MTLPPGPRAPSIAQLTEYVARPFRFFDRARERFGTPFTIRLSRFGSFVMLTDPAAIRDVFTGDPHVLHSGEGNEFMADTLGPNSLLVLDDEPHARQRRALLPPFHGERMRAHTAAMRDATLRRVRDWRVGGRVRLEEECREITLEVILRTVFGLDGQAEIDRFGPKVRAFMKLAGSRFGLFADQIPERLRPVFWAPFLKRLRAVTEPLLELVRERREEGRGGQDVLSVLFAMKHENGEPLTDHELRDHLFTLLLAGHDTTAVSLGWTFVDVLKRPDVLARIQDELRQAFPTGAIEPEGLARLPYLDATIRESLRLHPVVAFVVRKLVRPFTAGGVEYPAGVHLAPCMLLAHRDPELFPDPLTFRPERFLDVRPDPYRWFPFGGGTRRCIGQAFALFEMRVVLATLLRTVDFELTHPSERVRRHGLLLAPARRAAAVVTAVRSVPEPAEPVPAG